MSNARVLVGALIASALLTALSHGCSTKEPGEAWWALDQEQRLLWVKKANNLRDVPNPAITAKLREIATTMTDLYRDRQNARVLWIDMYAIAIHKVVNGYNIDTELQAAR